MIDGVEQGTLLGGEVISLDVGSGAHTIRAALPSGAGTYNVKFVLEGSGMLEIDENTSNWYMYFSSIAVVKMLASIFSNRDFTLLMTIGVIILILSSYFVYFRVNYFRIKPITT